MKKFLSMVMAAAMVVSLVPATAFAASDDVKATAKVVDAENYTQDEIETTYNSVVSGPEVQLTYTTADYTSGKGVTAEYTVTLDNAEFTSFGSLPGSLEGKFSITADGVTYTNGPAGVFRDAKNGSLPDVNGVEVKITNVELNAPDNDELTFEVTGKMQRGWVLAVDLESEMDKTSKGKTATVTVDSDDIAISNGDDLVYASVEAKGIKASVKDTVDVATDELAELKEIKIEPSVGDTLKAAGVQGNDIRLKLNAGFEFSKTSNIQLAGTNGPVLLVPQIVDDDEILLENIGDRIYNSEYLKITGIVVEATTAKAGATATIKVYADGCDTVSVEVAKVVDYTVTMSVDEDEDVPVMYSGVDADDYSIVADGEHESLEVTIEETFVGAWNNAKDFTLSVPEGVYIVDVVSPSMDKLVGVTPEEWFQNAYEEGDYETLTFDKRTWDETETGDDKHEMTFALKLVADPNFEGDVVLTLSGDAVDTQEVTIAKFVKPFTVEAQQNDLQIDYRNTEIPTDVVIKEAEAGLWNKGTTFTLELDNIAFDDDAVVTVDDKSGVEVKSVKTEGGVIRFEIDSRSSDEPAVITISNMTLYMNRSLPAGAYDLKVYSPTMLMGANAVGVVDKDAVTAPRADGFLGETILGGKAAKSDVIAEINDDFYSEVAKAGFVNIITAGREDTDSFTTKVVVPVGESYLISGENKVEIPVPAYINANGYTMLPLRAVAVALGINNNNVLWDQTTRTATVMYGSKIINMTLGQKVVYVNGAMIPATAAVEITNDRMFLGLRDLGNALGVTDITWDGATRTATLNGNK